MRALVQRVLEARVEVDASVVGSVGKGLLVFVGVMDGDTDQDRVWLANKVTKLRIFPEVENPKKMSRSVVDVGGSLLLVSQFTLAGNLKKGTRPSFSSAADPNVASQMFDDLVTECRKVVPCETGVFAADMKVHLVNDGPVTLWLDSRA